MQLISSLVLLQEPATRPNPDSFNWREGHRVPVKFSDDSQSVIFLNHVRGQGVLVEEVEFATGKYKRQVACDDRWFSDHHHYLSGDNRWLMVETPISGTIVLFDLWKKGDRYLGLDDCQPNATFSRNATLMLNGIDVFRMGRNGKEQLAKVKFFGNGLFRDNGMQLVIARDFGGRDKTQKLAIYSVPDMQLLGEFTPSSLKGIINPIYWKDRSIVLRVTRGAPAESNRIWDLTYLEFTYPEGFKGEPTIKQLGTGGGWFKQSEHNYSDHMQFGETWYARIVTNPQKVTTIKAENAKDHRPEPKFSLEIFDRKTNKLVFRLTDSKVHLVAISPNGRRVVEKFTDTEFRFHDVEKKTFETRVISRGK